MRVLVIRPERQAARTAEKLRALGHTPVIFPLFRPVHDAAAWQEAREGSFDAMAVTSAEAIEAISASGGLPPPLRNIPLFAVGKATANRAENASFNNVIASEGDGKGLARSIAHYNSRTLHPVRTLLYLAGATRTPIFEQQLAEQGVLTKVAVVYRMEPIVYSLAEQQQILVNKKVDAAFFFSRENARAFFDLEVFQSSRDALRKTLFFCLSRNIAETIPEELKKSAVTSLNPVEDELIDLL